MYSIESNSLTNEIQQNTICLTSSPKTSTPNQINLVTHNNTHITPHLANADTGTTGHYLSFCDVNVITNVQPLSPNTPVVVTLPNNSHIRATHSALLNFPHLPLAARHAYLFPHLTSSLISIGMLCDNGLTAHYHHDAVYIADAKGNVVLSGRRHEHSRLWMIDIASSADSLSGPPSPTHSAALAVHFDSIADRVRFSHAAFGSPAPSTFIDAISKGFFNLPDLSLSQVRKHITPTFATMVGHMDQQRQHSHHPHSTHHNTDHDLVSATDRPLPDNSDQHLDVHIFDNDSIKDDEEHQLFMDLTGRFPVRSRSGNNYIMVFLSASHNYIHLQPMKNRSADECVRAFQAGLEFFSEHNVTFSHVRLDNETSHEFEQFAHGAGLSVQFVPPHTHRANRAERAIRTFKNHFLATLATTHPDFPLSLWDRVLPQLELTVNLLRESDLNTNVSAYESVCGPFDLSAHPIAPIGMQVAIHNKPAQRTSWGTHAQRGYYLGPALKHFRCHRVFVTTTQSERISDTLQWFPHTELPQTVDAPLLSLSQRITDLTEHIKTQALSPSLLSPTDKEHLPSSIATLSQELRSLLDALITHTRAEQRVESSPSPPTVSPPPDATQSLATQPHREQRVRIHLTPPGLSLPPTRAVPTEPVTVPQPYNLRSTPTFTTRLSIDLSSPHLTHQCVHYSASLSLDPNAIPQPESYRHAMAGPDREHWIRAHSEEFVRLVETTQCMRFVPFSAKPANETATYYNPQVKLKMKNGQLDYRVRGTVGGDRVQYDQYRSSFTASLSTVKLLLNAVVSEQAEWMTIDIKDYYLGSPMEKPVYMHIPLKHIPDDIQQRYSLRSLAVNDKVLVEIRKGMYGLPHAGKLAQDRLIPHLAKHGYKQCKHTRCLFVHESRPIAFSLVVDDFGIKYTGKEHADHLISALRELYEITIDWTGSKYLGIVIDYDRVARTIRLSMPKYVENALERFGAKDFPGADSPMIYTPPRYGLVKQQQATVDNSAPLSAERKTRLQQIVGTFLYYARAVDPTMLTAINKIASHQAHPTENVELAAHRLLSYAKKWPDAALLIRPSDMILYAHSDASYLSETAARSRVGGFLFLGHKNNNNDFVNAAVEQFSMILSVVVASAAEAEYAALHAVGHEADPIRTTLAELGYPQPPTLITCDNQCAVGLATDTVTQKRTKAIDMRFHWIRDRVDQGQFRIEWKPGTTNLADFFTKAHSTKHHRQIRHVYVTDPPRHNALLTINSAKGRHALRRMLNSLSRSAPLQE